MTSFPAEKKAEYLHTVSRDLGFVCVCANAMSCEKNAAPRERPTQPGYMVLSGRFPTGVVLSHSACNK